MSTVALPQDFANRIREKTRSLIGEMIPEETITDYIKKEIDAIFTDKTVKYVNGKIADDNSYYNKTTLVAGSYEELTPVQAIIREELKKRLHECITNALDQHIVWDPKEIPKQFATEVAREIAPELINAMFRNTVQSLVNDIVRSMPR
jgi:hypothetical protein